MQFSVQNAGLKVWRFEGLSVKEKEMKPLGNRLVCVSIFTFVTLGMSGPEQEAESFLETGF